MAYYLKHHNNWEFSTKCTYIMLQLHSMLFHQDYIFVFLFSDYSSNFLCIENIYAKPCLKSISIKLFIARDENKFHTTVDKTCFG